MTATVSDFNQRWQSVQQLSATELASSQTVMLERCALLDLLTPLPMEAQDYMFERPITFAHGDGSSSAFQDPEQRSAVSSDLLSN